MGGRLRVDLDALAANYRVFQAAAAPGAAAAVVKADAYGLGAAAVAGRLWREGCRDFFVATADEGVALRGVLAAANIFVFEGAVPHSVQMLLDARLVPVLNHDEQRALWRDRGTGLPAAVHVDTGMHRLGFSHDVSIEHFDDIRICLLLTHLACADEPDHPLNAEQRQCFATICDRFPGIPASIGNSAGTLAPAARVGDLARPGIGLFGGNPFIGIDNPMQPVATLEGQILQVRPVVPGGSVGYGATWRASRPRSVAIVGVGYADGVPRLLSNKGHALVAGECRPIVGRVSMDLTAIDVTGLDVQAGDWVEFFGRGIPVDDVAAQADTIAYEILTGLGPRLRREYVGT